MALETVDITSYDAFRADVMGRGFNVDGQYGYQCWDLGATLWGNTGNYAYPYLSTGGTGYAYGCWTVEWARNQNAGNDFDLVWNLSDVKRGDMLILDRGRFSGDVSGHNAFADEDYNGTTTMYLVGQNQENPSATYGHVTTCNQMSVAKFLGAFRYKAWNSTPPTPPTPTQKQNHFKWALYARTLRLKRNNML